jgi:lipoprotein signal peptidase
MISKGSRVLSSQLHLYQTLRVLNRKLKLFVSSLMFLGHASSMMRQQYTSLNLLKIVNNRGVLFSMLNKKSHALQLFCGIP